MRGRADDQPLLFHVFDVEARIRPDHPLRDVKRRADRILAGMSAEFAAAYSRTGRPGVPPERLLEAPLLRALYSVRGERQLCERIDTDLLFRWFLDMRPGDDASDATAFPHNRKRLDDHGLTTAFFDAVAAEAVTAGLCSDHFSVDGTLIEGHASVKSFRPKGPPDAGGGAASPGANGFKPRNAEVDFHGQPRTNATHATDTMCDLLRAVAARGLVGPVTLVLDNARYQRNAVVMALAEELGIELLFLPSYSPNLNLIERLWRFTKRKAVYGRYHPTCADFRGAVQEVLDRVTTTHADKLTSLMTLSFQEFDDVSLLAA